jgi:hypothetical protein
MIAAVGDVTTQVGLSESGPLTAEVIAAAAQAGLQPYCQRKQREKETTARQEAQQRLRTQTLARAQKMAREAIEVDLALSAMNPFERCRLADAAARHLKSLFATDPAAFDDPREVRACVEEAVSQETKDARRTAWQHTAEKHLREQVRYRDPRFSSLSASERRELETRLGKLIAEEAVAVSEGDFEPPEAAVDALLDAEGLSFARDPWTEEALGRLESRFRSSRDFFALPFAKKQQLLDDLMERLEMQLDELDDSDVGADVSELVEGILDEAAEDLEGDNDWSSFNW